MTNLGLTFKTVFTSTLVLTLILISVQGAPAGLQNKSTKNCSDSDGPKVEESNEEYGTVDQRQNGTENYRINVKDVVVIWAPADSFLAATAALLDPQLLGEDFLGSENFSGHEKPQSGQNSEHPPVILELTENKPLEQNSSTTKPPEKIGEKEPVTNPTAKPVNLKRSGMHHPAFVGPFLKRKQ